MGASLIIHLSFFCLLWVWGDTTWSGEWVNPQRNWHPVIAENYEQFHRRNHYSLREMQQRRKVPIPDYHVYRSNQAAATIHVEQRPLARIRMTIHKSRPHKVPKVFEGSTPYQSRHRRQHSHHPEPQLHYQRDEASRQSHYDPYPPQTRVTESPKRPANCKPLPVKCRKPKPHHHPPNLSPEDCKFLKSFNSAHCTKLIKTVMNGANRYCPNDPFWLVLLPNTPDESPRLPPPTRPTSRPFRTTYRPIPTTARTYRPYPTAPYQIDRRPYHTSPRPYLTTPRQYRPTEPVYHHRSTARPYYPRERPRSPTFRDTTPENVYSTRAVPTTSTTTTTQMTTTTTTTTTPKPITYCLAPSRPENGLVVCHEDMVVAVEKSVLEGVNGNRKRVVYPEGTVCKYFCQSGYEVNLDDALIHCRKAKWNETTEVRCLPSLCPKAPNIDNALMSCVDPNEMDKEEMKKVLRGDISVEDSDTSNGKYRSATSTCVYKCPSDHMMIVPDRRGALTRGGLIRSWTITCEASNWNVTGRLPKCVKKFDPLIKCRASTVVLRDLNTEPSYETPKAISGDQASRSLRTKCFSIDKGQNWGVRKYTCETRDPFYDTNASCDFAVNVIGQCPYPPSPPGNGSVTCDLSDDYGGNIGPLLHTPGSFCHFSCDSGFVIPTSQNRLEVITCQDTLKWNETQTPSCVPQLAPTTKICDNVPPESQDPELLVAPEYISNYTGKKLDTNCTVADESGAVLATFTDRMKLSSLGSFVITCETYDPELRIGAQCNYTIKANEVEVPFNEDDVTDALDAKPERELVKLKECPALMAPANGNLDCSFVTGTCLVTCDDDHSLHFSTFGGKSKKSMTVACLKNEGRWDFMDPKGTEAKLPDCLGELPTTSFEVAMNFNVTLNGNCGDNEAFVAKTQDLFVNRNQESCASANCASWSVECWQSEKSSTLTFKWTVKASFSPLDFESSDGIPDAESLLEDVIKVTKNSINTDSQFRESVDDLNHALVLNSFRYEPFRLVCDKLGYGVDPRTDQCVECSSGMYHDGGEECEVCLHGTYQDETGASECKPCTATSATAGKTGARSQSEC